MNVANGFWLPFLKARGVPTVINVDGIEWERAKWGRLAKLIFHSGAGLTGKYADKIIFDSHVIARRWEAEFGRMGTFIPYGGSLPGTLHPVDNLKKRRYVLMVARFVPENTVHEFMEAAQSLAANDDVVIVGSSGYGGEIEHKVSGLCRTSPRVQWFGHVSDDRRLFSLWQNAGAYFHGHSVGGTNPALVQAMACGSPIVARDTEYNREVLGEAGLFVSPDSGRISAIIHGLMRDPAEQSRLSEAARSRAKARYTWEKVLDDYSQILLRTIEDASLRA